MTTMTIIAACMSFPSAYWSPYLKAPPYGLHEGLIGLAMMVAT